MLLSICIPTHHGRGWCLKPAVEAMLDQIEQDGLTDLVEICVSDNASSDETAAIMAAAEQRLPGNVRYYRFPLNVGMYNFFNSVRIATGEYCWFFGSDDMPEEGALKNAVEILRRYPNCSGISSPFDIYDAAMQDRQPNRPLALFPENPDKERQFDTFQVALVQINPSQTFMSVQIFKRELWTECIAAEPLEWVFFAPFHFHTYIFARILQSDPRWVWTPTKLVKMRGDNGVVLSITPSVSYSHPLRVLKDLTSIWTRVTGNDRELYRRVLHKAYRVDWSPSVVRHLKMLPQHTSKDDIDMLCGFTRYLASLPDFWWGSFPALLIPHWFWKFLTSSGALGAAKRAVRGNGQSTTQP